MKFLFPILILFLISFTSCSSDDDSTSVIENDTFNFTGTIVDALDNPIENASITLGEAEVFSDVNGYFSLNDIEVFTDIAYIITKKEGYLSGMRTLSNIQEENVVRISLLRDVLATLIGANGDSQVSMPTGLNLLILDAHIIKEDGSVFSGFMAPVIHHILPSNPIIDTVIPGNYENDGDTYGFAYIKLKSGDQVLDLADGYIATLSFRIEDSLSSEAPETLSIWTFNEATGVWGVHGEATKEYVLEQWVYQTDVSSFSNPWFKIKA